MAQRPKTLLDHVHDAIRLQHESLPTESASVSWIKRDMVFPNKRPPHERESADSAACLTYLAVQQQVAASTHHQARSALRFLSHDVSRPPLDMPIDAMRARTPPRWPTVLTPEEALQAMGSVSGPRM
jgi:Phage integrase, N-terminal SAM-like domain